MDDETPWMPRILTTCQECGTVLTVEPEMRDRETIACRAGHWNTVKDLRKPFQSAIDEGPPDVDHRPRSDTGGYNYS